MDRFILALGVLIAVCSATSPVVPRIPPDLDRDPLFAIPRFLGRASKEVRNDYFIIRRKMNITKAQEKEEVLAWAEKNNFTEYKEVAAELDKREEESSNKLAAIISKLSSVYDEYVKIKKDMNLTKADALKKMSELTRKNPKEYEAVMILLGMVSSSGFNRPIPVPYVRTMNVLQKMKARKRLSKS